MIAWLRDRLLEKEIANLNVDAVDISMAHRRMLQKKRLFRQLAVSFYQRCRSMDTLYLGSEPGRVLEIGSGSSIIRDIFPDVITSDIKPLPFVDLVCAGEALPFPDGGLRSIYGINVFHHLRDVRGFLREALRVLRPGGGIVLIEPYYGVVAQTVFRSLHKSETFDPSASTWGNSAAAGPISNANQALAYIVFKRDRKRFTSEFPQFELVATCAHTQLAYVLSGGVNYRQLVPDGLTDMVMWADRVLSPLNALLALQHTVVLRKRVSDIVQE